MKVISETLDFKIAEESAVTLGKFDGIHKGHQKLMKTILDQKKNGLKSVVFTFSKMPGSVFLGEKGQTILTAEERRIHLEAMGIDYMVECPFVDLIIGMEPEHFIKEILVKKLHARYIAVGTDFRFGHERKGDAGLLKKLSEKYDYRAEIVEKECFENEEISSSRVREALNSGKMELVRSLLGYPYYVSGTVIHGRRLGRKLGIPTINIHPDDEKMLPPNGVYLTKTIIGDQEYFGVTNVGVKPTVEKEKIRGIETNLFDFEGDLYGKTVTVAFYAFEREEKRFDSLDALKEQLKKDVCRGKEKRKLLMEKTDTERCISSADSKNNRTNVRNL